MLGFLAYCRRVRGGQCGYCGYDLRGGHQRCPECGEVVSTTGPAVPAVRSYGRVVSLTAEFPYDDASDLRLIGVTAEGTAIVRHAGADQTLRAQESFRHSDGDPVQLQSCDPVRGSAIFTVHARGR